MHVSPYSMDDTINIVTLGTPLYIYFARVRAHVLTYSHMDGDSVIMLVEVVRISVLD